MLIKYLGGRAHYKVSVGRKAYYFTIENKRTLDIKEQAVINYIFSLPNRLEFQVLEESIPVIKTEEELESYDSKEQKNNYKKAGRPKKWGK